jgi:hypothetical protein
MKKLAVSIALFLVSIVNAQDSLRVTDPIHITLPDLYNTQNKLIINMILSDIESISKIKITDKHCDFLFSSLKSNFKFDSIYQNISIMTGYSSSDSLYKSNSDLVFKKFLIGKVIDNIDAVNSSFIHNMKLPAKRTYDDFLSFTFTCSDKTQLIYTIEVSNNKVILIDVIVYSS